MSEMVHALRPATMRSKPVHMTNVFDDPGEVLDLIRERAPYPTVGAYYGYDMGGDTFPWFLGNLPDDLFVCNPTFVTAAREAFSAKIVQPLHCTLNLNGPAARGPAHVDLPVFKGATAPEFPIWLLMNMSYSGLFLPWLVPVASGLVWFHRGSNGEFEYWPDGPGAPSSLELPPLWNVGVMSDNEVMWHRVGAIGSQSEQKRLQGRMRASDTLHHVGGGVWEIRDGDRCIVSLAADELRISMLWKAYVFQDEGHLAAFRNPEGGLDRRQIVEIYLDDLTRRGIQAGRPTDLLDDMAWRELLMATYPSPFFGPTAGLRVG